MGRAARAHRIDALQMQGLGQKLAQRVCAGVALYLLGVSALMVSVALVNLKTGRPPFIVLVRCVVAALWSTFAAMNAAALYALFLVCRRDRVREDQKQQPCRA